MFRCEPCPSSTSVAWDLTGSSSFERSGTTATVTFSTVATRMMRMRLTRNGEVTIVSRSVTVNGRPTISFDFAPSSPLAGQAVAFSSQASDPENNPITRTWTFGDGATATGSAPTHAYAAAGTYTISAKATDSGGASSTVTRQITVRPDPGPTASFDFAPTVPDTGETVTLTSSSQASQGSIARRDWDLDGDGAFDDFSGAVATWAFDSPGAHAVGLRVEQTNGKFVVASRSMRVNGLPSANFEWEPESPVAGGSVDLVSTSSDIEGPLSSLSWDLDGDGLYGDGSEAQIRQPFPRAGTYDIGLQVTDSDGTVRTVRKQVVVAAPPAPKPPPTPPSGPTGGTEPSVGTPPRSPTRRTRLMSPFPVVRIAGSVLPEGALIDVLSVRAPRGSQIRVRCAGKGCPVGSVATTSATRLVRFRKFERRLRAGIRITVFVRQANRIGKYTRFLIRAGEPPKRVDLCLLPTRRSPGRCP